MTSYKSILKLGVNEENLRCQYLMTRMRFDMRDYYDEECRVPKPSDIYTLLSDDKRVDNSRLHLKRSKKLLKIFSNETLLVTLSPSCQLKFEEMSGSLQASINDEKSSITQFVHSSPSILAEWIARQIQHYDEYMDEWKTICAAVAKKAKTKRMTVLAIKAIVKEKMKEFPHINYLIFEQARRVKVCVRIPNTNLGVNIFAYHASYKQKLPEQFDNLRHLIEAHSTNSLSSFFTFSK